MIQKSTFPHICVCRHLSGAVVDGVAFVLFGILDVGQKQPLPSSLQRVLVRSWLKVAELELVLIARALTFDPGVRLLGDVGPPRCVENTSRRPLQTSSVWWALPYTQPSLCWRTTVRGFACLFLLSSLVTLFGLQHCSLLIKDLSCIVHVRYQPMVFALLMFAPGGDMAEAQLNDIKILTTPYSISLEKTMNYFKPGLPFDLEVKQLNHEFKLKQVKTRASSWTFLPPDPSYMSSLLASQIPPLSLRQEEILGISAHGFVLFKGSHSQRCCLFGYQN